MAVAQGNKITVEYTGTFENGEVFDSSEKHGQPLAFTAGTGMVVPGFDNAVIGMNEGEEKEVTLTPKDAYGEVNPQAVQKIPRGQIPPEAKVGMQIGIPLPNGQHFPAKITDMNDTEVTIDLNHPLAGKTLIFKIKVISIEQ